MVQLVLACWDRYGHVAFDPDAAPRYSREEDLSFRQEHVGVSVARHESGEVEITPWEHVRGGFRGMNSEHITLDESAVTERLHDAIREAFHRAK